MFPTAAERWPEAIYSAAATIGRSTVDSKLLGAGVVVLVVVVAALVVVTGVGPLGGNSAPSSDFPTGSGTTYESGGGSGDGGAGTTTEPPPFRMVIEEIESCGQTCRDVTGRLVNEQERQANGVTVYTRIFAGADTDGEVVWEGTQEIGALGPGEAERDTQRVELGMMDAAAVQNEGGEITIQTTVETDRQTVTFIDHRDVS